MSRFLYTIHPTALSVTHPKRYFVFVAAD